jgi:hypothetical protein
MATTSAEVTLSARTKRATPPKKTRIELAREFDESPLDTLVTTALLAAFLNISEAKLERDRWAGGGIPYIKDGRSVRYVKRTVLEYVQGKTRTSTAGTAGEAA